MKTKSYYIFTDCDLDGAGSYMMFGWLVGMTNIPYTVCRVNDLEKKIKGWLTRNSLEDYDEVLFFDLDVGTDGIRDLIDHPNVTVVDHHTTNIESPTKYIKAKMVVEEATSTCKLLYDRVPGKENLTKPQKLFMLLVDDYDSYELKSDLSVKLNDVFWSYQGDRVQKLLRDYPTGFTGFNKFHENVLFLKEKDIHTIKQTSDVYVGEIDTGKSVYRVASVVCNKYINEVADYVAELTGADASIVVNPGSSKVSFRKRNKESDISMVKLASILTDESGGHEGAAGGMLCDKFLRFTKRLALFTR